MIQRIQTLFLLLALICMSMFFFFPFGKIITNAGEMIPVNIFGVGYMDEEGAPVLFTMLPMLIIVAISSLTTLISIFLFKKRMLQIRFSIFNIIVQLGIIGLAFFMLIQCAKKIGGDYSTSVLIILPFVAAILTFLAIRAIARDEALVKSLDRIR